MKENPQGLERKLRRERSDSVVSNTNALRTGQLMDLIEQANSKLNFLLPDRRIVLVERNHDHLEEMMAKVLGRLTPNYVHTSLDHHMQHYVVHDGKIDVYTNLDAASPIVKVKARVKHPDSIAEKVPRKAEYFGRISEYHDKSKLMVGDVLGFEVVVRDQKDVEAVKKNVLALPFFRLEHEESHRKSNGYTSDHLNLKYENGNQAMRGLEVEVQVTDLKSHTNSLYNPEQDHDTAYAQDKLMSRHNLDGQLIIVGNAVKIPKNLAAHLTDELVISEVPNVIQPYTLVLPRYL